MSEQGPEVVLLRHGETAWSKAGRHTGRTDVELTEEGELRAKAVGERLAGEAFDLVLTSPLRRARQTAELAGLTPYELDDDLQEWDYGDFEGLTTAQIRENQPGWTIWDGPWPHGETGDDVGTRADRVVRRILHVGPDRRAAVVAHGHILRVLAARWLVQPVASGRGLALDTATISELGWEHDARVLRHWNVAAT